MSCEWQVPEVVPVFAQQYQVILKKRIDKDDDSYGAMHARKKTLEFLYEYPNGTTFLIAYFHEILHAVEQELLAKDLTRDNELDLAAHAVVQAFMALVEAQGDDE